MANERDNSGAMFQNDRKAKPTHPDYKGQATIDGVEYWVSGWIKPPTGKAKAEFLTMAFERKDAREVGVRGANQVTPPTRGLAAAPIAAEAPPLAKPVGGRSDLDDDIPF